MNFLSIDVGTTCIKYGLYDEQGKMCEYDVQEYALKEVDGQKYVDIEKIVDRVKDIVKRVSSRYSVDAVSFSSIGESFVLLDENDKILFYPMLYTDNRGEEQASKITEVLCEEEYYKLFGIIPHAMYSVSKLLYIKEKEPEIMKKAKKVMLVCDYLGYVLTGEAVIDYALASRTGVFDIKNLEFSTCMLDKLGLSGLSFSKPQKTGSIVGKVKSEFCDGDVTLVLGSHDQICATLGAGVVASGEAADGMGTVECITAVFEKINADVNMGKQGYPIVPFAVDGLYCTYILNFSCGSAVSFLRKNIMKATDNASAFFEHMEKNMTDEPSSVLTLPYFGGAGTPYQDGNAKGAIVSLTKDTSDVEVYQSLIESTAYEMKLNSEIVRQYGITIKGVVATGGGANSDCWLKKKADIQQVPIKKLELSEGGLVGLAMLSSVALKVQKNLQEARSVFVKYGKEFTPSEQTSEKYIAQYEKYKKLYKTLKEVIG